MKVPTRRNWWVTVTPLAVVPSPKSHANVHALTHDAPLLVVPEASKVTTSITFGSEGVMVKLGVRFGLVGRITPGGISRMSTVRVSSPRKSPESLGVTAIVTTAGTWPPGVVGAAGAR